MSSVEPSSTNINSKSLNDCDKIDDAIFLMDLGLFQTGIIILNKGLDMDIL